MPLVADICNCLPIVCQQVLQTFSPPSFSNLSLPGSLPLPPPLPFPLPRPIAISFTSLTPGSFSWGKLSSVWAEPRRQMLLEFWCILSVKLNIFGSGIVTTGGSGGSMNRALDLPATRKNVRAISERVRCVNSGIAFCSIVCAFPAGCVAHTDRPSYYCNFTYLAVGKQAVLQAGLCGARASRAPVRFLNRGLKFTTMLRHWFLDMIMYNCDKRNWTSIDIGLHV